MRSFTVVSLVSLGILGACASSPPPAAPGPGTPPTTTVAKASPPKHAAPGLRLPKTVAPLSYSLSMHMSPTEEHFTGKVVVDVKVAEATDVVWMHAGDNLTVQTAKVAGGATARVERDGDEMIGLVFDQKLAPGAYKLELAYEGKLPSRDGRGAYRQEEKGDWYIFTQFESVSARRAFPCFDEPGFKTPYTIAIEVPKDQMVFANTPETGTAPSANGWKTVSFAPSKPLPSYLVAYAVGPFEIVDAGKAGANKTPIRIIVPKGRTAEAKYAAETTGSIVERLEKYFGIPYPYEKLDHIAVPMKGGAIENPGLITYGTNTILGKPEDKSIRLQRGYLGIASHELGHIWFGDYVTTAWWDDIWLNEAFATWISAKIVHEMHPEWDGMVSKVQSRSGVMGNDSLVNARKIRQPIESKHDILNAFDGITYQKGGAVIGMFEGWVGEEPFRKGVHEYLNAHAYGNATAAEFLKEVGAHSGHEKEFAPAFSTFLDQAGIPLVTAELKCDKGQAPKLLVSQQRYLPTGSSGSTDQKWQVPVCASYAGSKEKSCALITSPSGEVPLKDAKTCPAWVNPNANGSGYYRVVYKGDMLQKLLANKALPVHERISVLGDALALERSGKMEVGELLGYVPGLVAENNRHFTGMTIGLVGGLEDKLVPAELEPNYHRFINKTYAAKANQLGWKPKAGEDDSTRLLRPGIVYIVAKNDAKSPLAIEAKKLAEAWLTDKKAIDHNLVGSVLGIAARHGDKALWDKFHTEAKKATDRNDRNHLLGAMGDFQDRAIQDENLKLVMSDEFDPRESLSLLYGADDDKSRQVAWDFTKANFDKIVARMPKDWGSSLVGVGRGFCDQAHKADLESFFKDKIGHLDGGPRNLSQALESMSLCIAQLPARQASVGTFMKKQ